MANPIEKFFSDQLSVWPMAASNFRALKNVEIRELDLDGVRVKLQHNPERIVSTKAEVDAESIAARPCFLCVENRPEEQIHLVFEGRKRRKYHVQLNPYPIFPNHLVIVRDKHRNQSIWKCFVDALDFSRKYQGYTVFYNGPMAGASAPDHMHFQACPQGLMPLEYAVDGFLNDISTGVNPLKYLNKVQDAEVYHYDKFTRGILAFRAKTAKSMAKLFYKVLDTLAIKEGEQEPRFNLFTWYKDGEFRTMLMLRSELRSHHYYSQGEDHLTMSPGCADMAGMFVVPCAEDFAKLDSKLLAEMLEEVSIDEAAQQEVLWRLKRRQRKISVGIMSAPQIEFEIISDGAGPQMVSYEDGRINYNGVLYDELLFEAQTKSTMFAEASFRLKEVTIGVDFHWQQKVDQCFAGSLKFIVEGEKITAINIVGVEDYLLSVISSEMKASASLDFLKAHAVISRSWVMSQLNSKCKESGPSEIVGEEDGIPVFIKWFDHEDHTAFDVCADDHCQRYQGLTMAVGEKVRKAIDATWGQVLCYDGEICDARFSKCCGGMMEQFSTCWEDKDPEYLQAKPDFYPTTSAVALCNTSDREILSQVLNDYDLQTEDFYTWQQSYQRSEISTLIRNRSGIDFGTIEDLVPLQRGKSGRISKLLVKGTKKSMIIGKELIIRRWLSESHLKSSAFELEWQGDNLILHGKGWGHGVGLCQIGAAVMAFKGYDYTQILSHYYPGSTLERI